MKGMFPAVALALLLARPAEGQRASSEGLEVSFGQQGLEKLSYGGEVLMDGGTHPDDRLHIWHIKTTDRAGKPRTDGPYGWGETNQGRAWDPATKTWTYTFQWGTIAVRYKQAGDAMDIIVTETNRAGSGVLLHGATIYPVTLRPHSDASGAAITDAVEMPGITIARWASAEVAAVTPDARAELWSGFEQHGSALSAIVSATVPDSLPPSAARKEQVIRPGESSTFLFSLRFSRRDTPAQDIAGDALRSFATRWPAGEMWKDRRVIGTVFLASSPKGDKTVRAGFPANPRRYFNDAKLDVSQVESFQARVLQQAMDVVANLKRMHAQGAITWDIEGEEYPQDTSYVCAPDMIQQSAPEMDLPVKAGFYAGIKLDDAYFKIIRDGGFRVGVCVRPQHFTPGLGGSARQVTMEDSEVATELIRKIRYAHDRWGATLFYLDSTVEADGRPLPPDVLEKAAAAFPDSLLIPEESTTRDYRAMAPFMSFLFHGETGTPDWIKALYPNSFGVNLVNDVDSTRLSDHHGALVDAVREGDVLMIHADSWHENNDKVVEIYRQAAKAGKRH